MARAGQKNVDDVLLLALAAGASPRAAAAQAQVSERTARRRLADPAFRSLVDEARAELVSQAVGRLAELGAHAVCVLQEVLEDEDAVTRERLSAARAALDFMLRGVEQQTLVRQVQELQQVLRDKGYIK